jgi:hypothetical protein
MVASNAPITPVATGTTIKTMLQLSTPSTRQIKLIGWGYELDAPPGADGTVDLVEADTAATVTAHVAAGVQPQVPGMPPSLLTLGTGNTGYTSSVETAPTVTRLFATKRVGSVSAEAAPVLSYEWFWLPGFEPVVAVSKFVRLRMLTPTTGVNAVCWVLWEE